MKKFNFKSWLINVLRRASYKWPARSEALASARIERGLYKCNMCNGSFRRKEVELDHIIPVINVKYGFTTWDEYINRLFCEASNYQVICSLCHVAKTTTENNMRKLVDKKKKR